MIVTEYDIELEKDSVMSVLTKSRKGGMESLVDELIGVCSDTARPMATYDTYDANAVDDETVSLGGVEFKSAFLRRCIEQRGDVHPFVMTLGRDTDNALYGTDDVLSQFILDTLYNLVLVKMERRLRADIAEEHEYDHCSKLSPGSLEYWPLSQQRPLFELLSDGVGAIDVSLDEKCIMHPTKSISGIIFQTRIPFSSCIFCSMRDCPGREQPYQIEKMEYYLTRI